jgi:hypothetical protein
MTAPVTPAARTPFVQSSPPLALVLAATMALAAAPLLAATEAKTVKGTEYRVVNQTGAAISCRYRVNQGDDKSWQPYRAIPAGSRFSLRAKVPGETVALDCNRGGRSYNVRPGALYRMYKNDAGKVAVGFVAS